eukprot:TRINITY_DN1360_c0_g2_i1.p1 TRINITY_DN1360_c0_g2~~TRINITY_DN1360_c0_g2_i1.p1  ORF type:complete len:283 (-),score=90.65 TRINITY_DN1360_c0_g2_i1:193-1008(-)
MTETKTKFWGDEDEDIEKEEDHEIGPDENGIKTIVRFLVNEKGEKVKLTRKVRVVRKIHKINKKVEERKKWKKFGECAGLPPGPEKGITSTGDEVNLDLSKKKQEVEKPEVKEPTVLNIQCRTCGGTHWTSRCPLKDKLSTSTDPRERDDKDSKLGAPLSTKPGVYVPPSMRTRTGDGGGDSMKRRDETATIRVTNLSEDTKESDLTELFRPFGPITRTFLAKDKHSGKSKGFAFINFTYKEDAAKAIEKLSGYGLDHLILHLEWAKPSDK